MTTTDQIKDAGAAVDQPIHVEIISDYQRFLDLEPAWNELVASAGLTYPFLEHVWIRTWWECFGEGHKLRILAVREGMKLIAIAPLMLTPVRMWGVWLYKLGLLWNNHVPRADFIITRRSQETYRAIWNHLRRDQGWDVIELCQLPVGSQTLPSILALAQQDQHRTGIWHSTDSPYLRLPVSWADYLSGLPPKHRSNLRNRFKRISAIGNVRCETIDSSRDFAPALADALHLEAAAWKGDAGTAIACDPCISRFYSLLAQRSAEKGWLRLHFLRAGAKRVAFDFSLAYKKRIFLLKIGYDPAYRAFSPYNLLLQEVLQNAIETGVDEFDFLGDNLEWKRRWTSETRSHEWLFVFAGSLKSRLVHTAKFRILPLLRRSRQGRANALESAV